MTGADPALVPILMYHSVADEAAAPDAPFTVAPKTFRRHVAVLREWGARTITVDQYAEALRRRRPLEPRTIVITVDDGYADTATALVPTLLEAGLTGTVFVTSGTVGTWVRRSRMITWEQVRDLRDAGVEIGAHAHHHVALDTVRRSVAQRELVDSRRILEDRLSGRVRTFAYPHGYWTRPLTRMAAEAGYDAACAAGNTMSHPGDHLYALSRLVVWRHTGERELLDLVEGRTAGVAQSARTLRRGAWRLARWTTGLAHPPRLRWPAGVQVAERLRLPRGAGGGERVA